MNEQNKEKLYKDKEKNKIIQYYYFLLNRVEVYLDYLY